MNHKERHKEVKPIMVDPGHGGRDPGAIGYDPWKLREADVVWSVAQVVRSELRRHGIKSMCSRRQGTYASLAERASKANDADCELFVSIHANSFISPLASGLEVLHYGSKKGKRLAVMLMRQLVPLYEELTRVIHGGTFIGQSRDIRERPYLAVLRLTSMPAAMVKLPFISNPYDLEILSSSSAQVRFGYAIALATMNAIRPRHLAEDEISVRRIHHDIH